jgi:hypothetical protein
VDFGNEQRLLAWHRKTRNNKLTQAKVSIPYEFLIVGLVKEEYIDIYEESASDCIEMHDYFFAIHWVLEC